MSPGISVAAIARREECCHPTRIRRALNGMRRRRQVAMPQRAAHMQRAACATVYAVTAAACSPPRCPRAASPARVTAVPVTPRRKATRRPAARQQRKIMRHKAVWRWWYRRGGKAAAWQTAAQRFRRCRGARYSRYHGAVLQQASSSAGKGSKSAQQAPARQQGAVVMWRSRVALSRALRHGVTSIRREKYVPPVFHPSATVCALSQRSYTAAGSDIARCRYAPGRHQRRR